MVRTAIVAIILAFLPQLGWTDDIPFHFKGYKAINQNLTNRIFKTGEEFSLGEYLGSEDLGALMGTYGNDDGDGVIGDAQFINGIPNSLNMMLWYTSLSALANDLSNICAKPNSNSKFSARLSGEAINDFMTLCRWPKVSDENLMGAWLRLIVYDAPQSEFESWKSFGRSLIVLSISRDTALQSLYVSALMNPYFLLRQ